MRANNPYIFFRKNNSPYNRNKFKGVVFMYMIKSLLYGIVTLPLSIVSFVSCFLAALVFVLAKPIRAAFGMKEEYNNGLDGLVNAVNILKDTLKFN